MKSYLLRNLSELAEKRAINIRQEAQLWDILARDLKREAGRQEDEPQRKQKIVILPQQEPITEKAAPHKMFVRVKEASTLLGLSRSSLYKEISIGNLKIKKAGRITLIAMADIHDWCERLK